MNPIVTFYPTDALGELGNDFAQCVSAAAMAKDALVGPVVLAAMAAAVHGVIDVRTPYFQVMPTSLYVSVIASSGMRKSTVVRFAFKGFSEFESLFNGRNSGKLDFAELGSHPYVWEDASESGITDLFANGAKAACIVMDEGGMLEARLNKQAWCKRYDGSAIRNIRKHQITQIAETRTTFCMTVQDAVFEKMLKGKEGALMLDSGLMARNLLSYATYALPYISYQESNEDPNESPFHDRVQELMEDYREILKSNTSRTELNLSPEAVDLWKDADKAWKSLPQTQEEWIGMDSFCQRAGEQAIRIAAVLQWFNDPKPCISGDYMENALKLVEWHMDQALIGFGLPSQDKLEQQLTDELYDYLMRRFQKYAQGAFFRLDLLRKGPKNLRRAGNLDFAIDNLVNQGKVIVRSSGKNMQVIICTN